MIQSPIRSVLMAAGILLSGSLAVAAQEPVVLKLHDFVPAVAPTIRELIAPWAEQVGKDSAGRLRIDIYPQMQLGGRPPQLIDQVRDGTVEIAHTLIGYTPGRFPKLDVFELPFMFQGARATNRALIDYIERHVADDLRDYKLILPHVHAGDAIHSVRRPIRTVADLRGLKIRVPSAATSELVKALGGIPIGAPVPETPQMLSTGVIDGAIMGFEIAASLKVVEMVKQHAVIGDDLYTGRLQSSVFLLLMNRKAYDGLSAELRAVIDRNSGAAIADKAAETYVAAERRAVDEAVRRGNQVTKITGEDLQKLRQTADQQHQAWVRKATEGGLDGAGLLADAKALLAKYQ